MVTRRPLALAFAKYSQILLVRMEWSVGISRFWLCMHIGPITTILVNLSAVILLYLSDIIKSFGTNS